MFRRLVKTTDIEVQERVYPVRYYEATTARGGRRYSSEIILAPGDRIILDDDSMKGLESRVSNLVPATLYSRLLASKTTVAA